ncbi:MAG TPA: tetraacyldisaccharide 4'-kinase [Planctomycetota bacterium]|nr:tetraacyldisaccharide 4'-kinase [Planctomycetota bacterium]
MDSPLRWLATPAWALYRPLIGARNLAYDVGWKRSVDLGAPTIAVGNLTVGGTGKTPLVALIAAYLRDVRERNPAVLSRGYGAARGEANDEARMLGLPAFCDPDRVAAASRARAAGHDCLILDDAFQHRRARRDLDLVLIDATRPWGAKRAAVLPLGLLREPRGGLRRADALVVTRVDAVPPGEADALVADLARHGRPVWRCHTRPLGLAALDGGPLMPATGLSGRPVVLASGIGNPLGFERMAAALGWDVRGSLRFPDHHGYRPADVERILAEAQHHAATVVVTEKDAVKLKGLVAAAPCLAAARALRITGVIDPQDEAAFLAAIDRALARSPSASR